LKIEGKKGIKKNPAKKTSAEFKKSKLLVTSYLLTSRETKELL
jgi:hypothetical protein